MVVLSLTSVLLGMWTAPAYRQLLEGMRLETKARQLFLSVQFARTYAMQHRRKVIVCKSSDAESCGGAWRDGWIVLAEFPKQVLQVTKGLHANQSLAFYGAGGVELVEFKPLGTSYGYNGRLVLCSKHSKVAWFIFISPTGRARLEVSQDLSYCN